MEDKNFITSDDLVFDFPVTDSASKDDTVEERPIDIILSTEQIFSAMEASTQFYKLSRCVDEHGLAMIIGDNRLKYALVDFEEYRRLRSKLMRAEAKLSEGKYETDLCEQLMADALRLGCTEYDDGIDDDDDYDPDEIFDLPLTEPLPDDMYLMDALSLAIKDSRLTTAMLQRTFQVGYGRAARMIDTLKERGYIALNEAERFYYPLIGAEEFDALVKQSEE